MVVKIAHRGDPLRVRENTLASVESAVAAGADWVEVDVKLTRDGVPVLLHDHTLTRLWGVDRRIASVAHAELEHLVGDGECRIPTLHEALDLVVERRATLMIDVSGPAEGQAAARVVRALECHDRVVFTGDPRALADIRAGAAHVRIAMSWKSPLLPDIDLVRRVRPDYLNRRHIWLTRRNVRSVQRRGMKVSTWTVDHPRRMAAVAAAGVDAITTNDIRALVRTLAAPRRGGEAAA
ncbi:glycerophosphodiester phosphodiesterase [Yinghuangia sp. YIM S10712]|uniref:glycerophosphodiester phosphodiesterase n=1 Tax=Yinghuangia sp. YIM S10712 TaxID=3436930 RepID=UPI003F52EECA